MNVEDKFNIVRGVGEHCHEDNELFQLIANKNEPVCLDGFEPSGRIHIAQGLMRIINAKKLIKAGCKLRIVIADNSAFLNSNFGGDEEKIRTVGLYMIELLKAAGLDAHGSNVEFLWSSEQSNSRANEYWTLVMHIAQSFKLPRVISCVEAMVLNKHNKDFNKQNQDDILVGKLLNICMKCADIFFLEADICQMGLDQQTVGLLAREYADVVREKKPIVLSHHLLPGLKQGQEKMSKSIESSCIFMDDNEAELNAKIKKAYCPPSAVQGNPLIDYIKWIIFPWDGEFKVERSDANGGEKIFKRIEDLISDYENGRLHPADLKASLSKALNKILQRINDHFNNDSSAKKLLVKVKKLAQSNTHKSHPTPKRHMSTQSDKSSSNSSISSSIMSLEKKFNLVRSIGEECIQEDELRKLLSENPEPVCYDGFEPSGKMHIAQGVMKMINVNKLIAANCKVKIWIADWFAQLNNKMGGDLEKIQTVGEYMIEIWKAVGLDLQGDKVEFLWASKEINSRADEYWSLVMDIARRKTVSRIKRCVQIMGRSEQDELTVAQFLYPCMQCADVFFLEADICQLGMDQRKVNVLAREYCDDIKRKKKPIILSHHILPGLKQGQEKMSKSDPSSSLFMTDNKDIVNKKIEKAYCPPCLVDGNPCFEYIKHLIFPQLHELKVIRNVEQGGDKTFSSFEEVVEDYESGRLLPIDLKYALSKALNEILHLVEDNFKNNPAAKKLQETVEGFTITR